MTPRKDLDTPELRAAHLEMMRLIDEVMAEEAVERPTESPADAPNGLSASLEVVLERSPAPADVISGINDLLEAPYANFTVSAPPDVVPAIPPEVEKLVNEIGKVW